MYYKFNQNMEFGVEIIPDGIYAANYNKSRENENRVRVATYQKYMFKQVASRSLK